MNVRSITLHNLFCHCYTSLVLPASGIVLVRGPNGSGKSALVEAVSVALWGKTLRGAEPWLASATECSATVEAMTGLVAERTRTSKKTELTWSLPNREPVRYENVTKAQIALDAVIGSWDVWRRSSVFSSQDAANFSRATDGERKRLLESVLCLSAFDDASSRCRTWLRDVEGSLVPKRATTAMWMHRVEWNQDALREAERRLEDAPAESTFVKDDSETNERIQKLRHMRDLAYEEELVTRKQLTAAQNSGAENNAIARQLRGMLAQLRNASTCPTCGQVVSDALRGKLQAQADSETRTAVELQQQIADDLQNLEGLVEELRAEIVQLDKTIQALQVEQYQAKKSFEQAETLRKLRQSASTDVENAKEAIASAEAALDRVTQDQQRIELELATARACDTVLGLRGVRAHILGEALDGIEAVANHWVDRLFSSQVRVRLSPYSEKKTGGVSDAISLSVEGLGQGGYASCSGGERRRLDVALLLALAEIASASSGQVPGTLFLDEVFDTLDSDSVERVSEALQSIADERCVVVISHSEILDASLQADMRVFVESGKICIT
jgi:DNA repair exonuclease SbcCD ATPase subunit